MAARTGGTVVADAMDRLESVSAMDIGGLGSGAAITQFSFGGWFMSQDALGSSANKCLCAWRDAEAGAYVYLGIVNVQSARRLRLTISDDLHGSANHYSRPTELDGEDDVYPPPMTQAKLWWFGIGIDASAALAAPDTIDVWAYSPSAALGGEGYALRKIVMGHGLSEENDFLQNTRKFSLGGWGGVVSTAANQDKAHECDHQGWWFMPSILTLAQAQAMTTGRAARSALVAISNRRSWSLREPVGTRYEEFNSGNNLAASGTVSSVTNFSGVDTVPTTVALAGTPLNNSTDATSYTLSSVTTEANKPILVAIAVARATTQAVQGVTGGGLTWNQVGIKQYGTANTIFLYAAYPTSAATFDVTIDCNDGGGNHLCCIAIPFVVSGSINSASFKVQSVTDSGTGITAEPFTTPLSAFATGSGTLMLIGTGAAGSNIVPTSPMTELSEISTATPVRFLAVHFDSAGDTTPQATLGSGTWGVIAVEVALAPVAGNSPGLNPYTLNPAGVTPGRLGVR